MVLSAHLQKIRMLRSEAKPFSVEFSSSSSFFCLTAGIVQPVWNYWAQATSPWLFLRFLLFEFSSFSNVHHIYETGKGEVCLALGLWLSF